MPHQMGHKTVSDVGSVVSRETMVKLCLWAL